MPRNKKSASKYTRSKTLNTPLIPNPTPGNLVSTHERADDVPRLEAQILPGTQPVAERLVSRRITQQTFNGPLPHPEIFRKYGEVISDAPERIMRVFEEDSAHLRDLQMGALNAQKADNRRVHWMAYSLIAGGYAMSALFAYWDKEVLAGIVLTTTIIGTVTGFLQTQRDAQAETESKEPPTAE